ncbi:Sensor histidine kinase regulating citrate/malate metabolism [Arthrobacter subterraneus]|uniref:histidine kinase n=1 Tax=Arthrobacter subterraneus TaxID=335973 RepID=A0A1G8NJY7_9MICC|nr:sensor histidine kinase [Arthrobacter subterraneus]SDI80475.1 Sensor histidine kinase regulating citrate/malate metabolism [Arthrobacter subterraneus]
MKNWSLARQFFVGQLVFVLALTSTISWVLYLDAEDNTFDAASQRMLAVATTFADDPYVLESVESSDPTGRLQPYAVEVMDDLGVDFVTIMDTDRTRYTHRNPGEIGGKYIGSIDQALAGDPHVEVFTGTLGPSVRAIVPVFTEDDLVTALVAAGVTVDTVSIARNAQLPLVWLIAAGALTAGTLVSLVLSRHLRRATLGLGTEQLSRMFVFYDSVLHSVRDGLVLTDLRGKLVLYNDQAAALLNLPPSAPGDPKPASGVGLSPSVEELLMSGRRAVDEIHVTDDRVLVVNQEPAVPASGTKPLGTVTTIRDHTELETLSDEVQTMRTLTEALRAQTHEHANRLHTIVSLIELDRRGEALEFATRDLQQSQQLTDEVVAAIDEPFITALLVGKAAQANERGLHLVIDVAGTVETSGMDSRDLVTIIGNLLDNAFDAAASSSERSVTLAVYTEGEAEETIVIEVSDSGPGLSDAQLGNVFTLGSSSKGAAGTRGLGLALVRQAVHRLGGTIRVTNDGGALFTVRLPAVPRADHPQTANRSGEGELPRD